MWIDLLDDVVRFIILLIVFLMLGFVFYKTNIKIIESKPVLPANLIDQSYSELHVFLEPIADFYPVNNVGRIILDESVKHRFDYFLLNLNHMSLPKVAKMAKEDIALHLKGSAKIQAEILFDDYALCKNLLFELERVMSLPIIAGGSSIEHLLENLQVLRKVYQKYSLEYNQKDHADYFFSFNESLDDFMRNHLAIQHDSQLSISEKKTQLEILKQSLTTDTLRMRFQNTSK